jgi:hypothetical protein
MACSYAASALAIEPDEEQCELAGYADLPPGAAAGRTMELPRATPLASCI